MPLSAVALFAVTILCVAILLARGGRLTIKNSRGNFVTGKVKGDANQTYTDHSRNEKEPETNSKRDAYDWANLFLTLVSTLSAVAGTVIAYLALRGGKP